MTEPINNGATAVKPSASPIRTGPASIDRSAESTNSTARPPQTSISASNRVR